MSRDAVDALYLSPHLDDAALSCGGQIFQRSQSGQSVAIATIFSADEPIDPKSSLVRTLHSLFGLERDVVAARRKEDLEACAILGAAPIHLDETEGIYRLDAAGAPLYPRLDNLFADLHPDDRESGARLAQRLHELPKAREVFAPLGVGGHVDHVVVREAARLAYGDNLRHYEDFPYVEKTLSVRRVVGFRGSWSSEVVSLTEASVEARVRAIGAYVTQLKPLFGSAQRLEARVRRHVRRTGGERLWRQDTR